MSLPLLNIGRRPALASDKETLRLIHHAAYRDLITHISGGWSEPLANHSFDKAWALGATDVLLANNHICGYCLITRQSSGYWVDELVVDPSYQSRGIGSSVLQAVMKEAGREGVRVAIETAKPNRAVHLFLRLGFLKYEETFSHTLMEWHLPVPVTTAV